MREGRLGYNSSNDRYGLLSSDLWIDRYDRVVRVLGENVVEGVVQQDIQEQKVLEEKRQMEQMPKGSIHERLAWGARKSEMENKQRKKNKTKNRGMER